MIFQRLRMLRDDPKVETRKLSSSEVVGGEQVEELECSFGRDSLVLVLTDEPGPHSLEMLTWLKSYR